MEYEPVLDWENVADPENPPAGARLITSKDLLRYENALEQTEQEFIALPGKITQGVQDLSEKLVQNPIWPDLAHPGLWLFAQGGQLVPSGMPGLYDLDTTSDYKSPIEDYVTSVNIETNDDLKFTRKDGTTFVAGKVNRPIPPATSTTDGLMTKTDKALLDGATSSNNPSTLVRRTSTGTFNISAPSSAGHPATKDYADKLVTDMVTKRGELGATHLDTIRDYGLYYTTGAGNIIPANGYPVDGASGSLFVRPFSGTTAWIIQEWIEWSSLRTWKRGSNGNTSFTAWVETASTTMATSLVNGLMSAADKAKLDAAAMPNKPSTIVMRDVNGNINAADPTNTGHVSTKKYVDDRATSIVSKERLALSGIPLDRLQVGAMDNLTPDPFYTDPEVWHSDYSGGPGTGWVTNVKWGNAAASFMLTQKTPTVSNMSLYATYPRQGIPVRPGEVYSATTPVYSDGPAVNLTTISQRLYFYDKDMINVPVDSNINAGQLTGAEWTEKNWVTVGGELITVPADAVFMRPRITVYYAGGVPKANETKWYVGPTTTIREKGLATSTQHGIMNKADKALLDGATYAATPNTLPKRSGSGQIWVGEPTNPGAATTKSYVDSAVSKPLIGTILPTSNSDLDLLTTPGTYIQELNVGAQNGYNYPTNKAGWLEVRKNTAGTMIWQQYQTYGADNKLYWRASYNSDFYVWKEAADKGPILWEDLPYNKTNFAPYGAGGRPEYNPLIGEKNGVVYIRGAVSIKTADIKITGGSIVPFAVINPKYLPFSDGFGTWVCQGSGTDRWTLQLEYPTGIMTIGRYDGTPTPTTWLTFDVNWPL